MEKIMAWYKNLFDIAQTLVEKGKTYIIGPNEIKELPDSFRGRMSGMLEEVTGLVSSPVPKVEDVVVQDEDKVLDAIMQSSETVVSNQKVIETETPAPTVVPVKQKKSPKKPKKNSKKKKG